jgi:hypothetical protein
MDSEQIALRITYLQTHIKLQLDRLRNLEKQKPLTPADRIPDLDAEIETTATDIQTMDAEVRRLHSAETP